MNHTTIRIAVIILSTTAMMIVGTGISMIYQQRAYAPSSISPIVCPASTALEVTLQGVLVTLPEGTILCMAGNFSPQTITAIPPSGSFLESIFHIVIVTVLVQPQSNGSCPAGFQLAIIRTAIAVIPVSAGMCVQLL